MSTSPARSGSCLTCMHYDRIYRSCRYDRIQAGENPGAAPRLDSTVDVRTFRCADYLSWENELLPFTSGEGKPSR